MEVPSEDLVKPAKTNLAGARKINDKHTSTKKKKKKKLKKTEKKKYEKKGNEREEMINYVNYVIFLCRLFCFIFFN